MLQHGCSVCQEALKTCRETATSLGLWLRPRLFQLAPVAADEEARPAVPGSDSSGSPGTEYSDYETLYLACSTAKEYCSYTRHTLGRAGFFATDEGLTCLLEPTCNATVHRFSRTSKDTKFSSELKSSGLSANDCSTSTTSSRKCLQPTIVSKQYSSSFQA